MAGALDGVRVLELGIWVAVPSAAAVLADWGARVVKIEPPEGDPLRGLAATGLVPYQPDVNPAFQLDNRGKRSVTLDLRRPEGREVAHALVRRSDVFLTNLRRQKLAPLGMDYATLRRVHPRLVYAGLTGYGTEGPERERAAFDYAAFWARAGIMGSLGEPEGPPPTQRPGMGDHMTGLGLAGAIAAALFARERSGVGQEIGMSLFGSGIWMLASDIQAAMLDQVQRAHALYSAGGTFRSAQVEVKLTVEHALDLMSGFLEKARRLEDPNADKLVLTMFAHPPAQQD